MKEENIHYFENKDEIKTYIQNNWKKGDSILFKASNGMRFFDIVEELVK